MIAATGSGISDWRTLTAPRARALKSALRSSRPAGCKRPVMSPWRAEISAQARAVGHHMPACPSALLDSRSVCPDALAKELVPSHPCHGTPLKPRHCGCTCHAPAALTASRATAPVRHQRTRTHTQDPQRWRITRAAFRRSLKSCEVFLPSLPLKKIDTLELITTYNRKPHEKTHLGRRGSGGHS